ncbi:aminotransferase A [Tumebacillus flagellatus]|uniref:Aminotransferase n=1 Tax=Tumebacillus flagellatus TaxID=1157490 RepID=A0A074LMZ1_9BACL|nr:aminotransferase A [Tumebacillus flagellatus]KEO81890.1 aromatic amino acid aminotransferase [Tumebacillus flagellatus]
MEHLVNPQVREIEVSGIRKFSNRVAAYPYAISLTLGQPDFPTPEHIKKAAQRAIETNRTVYTHNAGLLELRQAACNFVATRYGQQYDPETEVITTVGASEAIDIALRTILVPGSEVILPGPVYPGYEPIIKQCGGIPVYVDTRETGFKITAVGIAEKLTDKTRAVLLPYPSNPTGVVMSRQDLKEIADVLRDREIFVVSDEIYSELVYSDEGHRSIVHEPGMRDKTIVINGLSKSHSMTGWRIGFTFAPAAITQHMLKVHQYNVSCASSISQYAALEALTHGMDDALAMRVEYRKRLDYVHDRLDVMGIPCVKPDGAFYLFPSIGHFGLTSQEFCVRLLEQEQLAVVPGDAFSEYGEGFMRISYAYSMDSLKEALDRLQRFVLSL